MPAPLHLTDLGCRDFLEVQELQRSLVARRREGAIPDTLLFCSHPPVVTAGRSASAAEIAAVAPVLAQSGLPLYPCERGGRLTYHGPGQVLGYPIVLLEGPDRDLHAYLRRLETVLLAALAGLGIAAERRPGHAGVWVGEAKLASIGVAVRGWVTWHGFALNLTGDLTPFGLFDPCGISGLVVTSVTQITGKGITRAEMQGRLGESFCREFARAGLSAPAEGAILPCPAASP
jgi:lipoate-protein ligase B